MPATDAFTPSDRDAVYRAIRERRDIRTGFQDDAVPDDVLVRLLGAAHAAPSVGSSKPWDFVVVKSAERRQAVQEHVRARQDEYRQTLPAARAALFEPLRIDAITRTPVNIAVTCDRTRGGWYTLGALDESEGLARSVGFAVENLWLAARAEGIGICLVGAFDQTAIGRLLELPEHLEVIAYVCLGYVAEFPAAPELETHGWTRRRPLAWAVHQERYGRRGLPGSEPVDLLAETASVIAEHPVEEADADPPAVVLTFAAGPVVDEVSALLTGGSDLAGVAKRIGAELCVIDVGLATDLPVRPGLLPRAAGPSARGPAESIYRAVEIGVETARDFYAAGNACLIAGVVDHTAHLPALAGMAWPATLGAQGRQDIAALAGCLIGAAALGVPVVTHGSAAAVARAVVAWITGVWGPHQRITVGAPARGALADLCMAAEKAAARW